MLMVMRPSVFCLHEFSEFSRRQGPWVAGRCAMAQRQCRLRSGAGWKRKDGRGGKGGAKRPQHAAAGQVKRHCLLHLKGTELQSLASVCQASQALVRLVIALVEMP